MHLRHSFITLTILVGLALPASTPRFIQYPTVQGDKVVFTWDGDLWSTTLKGGPAQRLTSHPGNELAARISPDGKWIAFSGSYDGGLQVYLMPFEGGTPRRLTWRGNCTVQGWTPDGQRILYRSAIEATGRPVDRLYTVDLEGHEPEALPLQKGMQGAFGADGRLAFSSRGREEYYWKRYKGGAAQDLWLADLKSQKFEPLTDYPGRNASPMWAGNQVLFISDRAKNGITNLFQVDPGTKAVQQLTDFPDFDVQWPSTDGRTVVFAQAGYLTAMDVASHRTTRLAVQLATDDWKRRPRNLNPNPWLLSQNLATNGKTLTLEARGEVFLVSLDGKSRPVNLTGTPGARERLPVLSPDGSRVAYVSDQEGNYDLYVKPVESGAAVRIPTGVKGLFSRLIWSPDGKKLLFGDQTFALYVVDVEGRKTAKVAASNVLQNDQFTWEQADYVWAPDSTWIAFSFQEETRNGRVWLLNTATGQKVPVTNGFYASLNPCFDADGSRLYFLSHSNFHTVLDPSQDNHIQDAPVEVMSVALKAKEEAGPFRIDLEGLTERVTVLPLKAGNHFHLKAGKGVVAVSSLENWDEPAMEEVFRPKGEDKWTLRLFDVAKGQETVLAGTVSDWHFSPEGTSLLVRKGTSLHAGPLAAVMATKALPPRVDLSGLNMTVDPREEWAQIFQDTWRFYRDFFYDKGMHGQDWQAIGDKFRAWLPDCPNRADLNWLLSQMVGELCVGHTYVGGGDFAPAQSTATNAAFTGLLGADFEADHGLYRFQKVFGPTPYAPGLRAPLAGLAREGEYLLAINGEPLRAPGPIHARLQVTRGQKVKLTLSAKPTMEGARTVEVEPVASEGTLRYEAWVARNIAEVDRLSGGQLGYIHLTAMGEQNIGQFDKYWRAFRFKKGIVIDVRGNGGGWTEFFMIDKLERQLAGFNTLRDMAPFRYPGTASDGRFIFLSNEQNGSDGECFLAHAKARNLGTIVGTRSWGGLVGILNTQPTLDGGTIDQPNNAFFGREGKWWIENEGAIPDLLVENGPDPRDGDRQLRVGVETLLNQLRTRPTPPFPSQPAYPRR
jgi:tricorn protease